ncbi:hypothetical protein LEMLEM_LOCUS3679, partial [Lemmus lemmus]
MHSDRHLSAGHTTGCPRAGTSAMKSVVSSHLEDQIRPSTQVSLQLQKGDKRFSPTQAQEEHQEIKSTLLLQDLETSSIENNAPDGSTVSKDQSPGQRLYIPLAWSPSPTQVRLTVLEESALPSSLQNLLTQIK